MPNAVSLPNPVAELPEVGDLRAQLRRRGVGHTLDSTKLTRALYSSDASLYRVVPQAVAHPRTVEETGLPALEKPESAAGRMVRLRQRLARSQSPLGRGLLSLLSRDVVDEDTWEEIEDTLITADVGVGPTHELVERHPVRPRQRQQQFEIRAALARFEA